MKKLTVLLQIIGLLAVCPLYVFLEITHYTNGKSELNSGSGFKPKTEIMSPNVSTDPASKTQSAVVYLITN